MDPYKNTSPDSALTPADFDAAEHAKAAMEVKLHLEHELQQAQSWDPSKLMRAADDHVAADESTGSAQSVADLVAADHQTTAAGVVPTDIIERTQPKTSESWQPTGSSRADMVAEVQRAKHAAQVAGRIVSDERARRDAERRAIQDTQADMWAELYPDHTDAGLAEVSARVEDLNATVSRLDAAGAVAPDSLLSERRQAIYAANTYAAGLVRCVGARQIAKAQRLEAKADRLPLGSNGQRKARQQARDLRDHVRAMVDAYPLDGEA